MKLELDLVPESAWGKNLRTEMGRTNWEKLRKNVLAKQGNVCAICGSTEKLQCHEIWEYNDKKGIQSLRGFQAICSLCHLGSHFGLAQKLATQGYANLDNIIAHFLKVNEISREIFEEKKNAAFSIWRIRSDRKWKLEMGEWSSLAEHAKRVKSAPSRKINLVERKKRGA